MPLIVRRWLVFAGFLALCLAGGGVGAVVTGPAVSSWYPLIAKPAWTPPNALFGPVWTVLYVMIGIAGWQIWRGRDQAGKELPLAVWFGQLALNFAWTPLFFGARAVGWALIDISGMWLLIGIFVIVAWRRSKGAAFLFVPYWVWVSYATALNLSIWVLNGPA